MAAFAPGEGWQIYDAAGRRKYLSSDERTRFLRAADSLPLKERTLCYVLVYAGCRVSEALAATRHNIDTDRCAITMRTLKRRRLVFRTVPVPQSVVDMMARLPTSDDGRFWHMHRVTAWRVVKWTMLRAGIVGPMSCPKGLRHGFGIRAADRSVPPNLIQRWMGMLRPPRRPSTLTPLASKNANSPVGCGDQGTESLGESGTVSRAVSSQWHPGRLGGT